MKKILRPLVAVLFGLGVLCIASDTSARSPTTVISSRLAAVTANAACNASVHLVDTSALTCRAFEVFVSRGDSLRLSVTWAQTAGADLTVWADTSPDGDAPWSLEATPIVAAAATGVIDMTPASMVIDASADGSLSWEFTSFTSVNVRFRFVWTSGGAADLITVTTQHR